MSAPTPILQKVYDRLKAIPGFQGTPGVYRVHSAGLLPQPAVYPAATYQVISASPADSITQLGRFTSYRVQVSIYDRDDLNVAQLRTDVLAAIEAMPEYITRETDLQGTYIAEPKVFEWILDFHLRDIEA